MRIRQKRSRVDGPRVWQQCLNGFVCLRHSCSKTREEDHQSAAENRHTPQCDNEAETSLKPGKHDAGTRMFLNSWLWSGLPPQACLLWSVNMFNTVTLHADLTLWQRVCVCVGHSLQTAVTSGSQETKRAKTCHYQPNVTFWDTEQKVSRSAGPGKQHFLLI